MDGNRSLLSFSCLSEKISHCFFVSLDQERKTERDLIATALLEEIIVHTFDACVMRPGTYIRFRYIFFGLRLKTGISRMEHPGRIHSFKNLLNGNRSLLFERGT